MSVFVIKGGFQLYIPCFLEMELENVRFFFFLKNDSALFFSPSQFPSNRILKLVKKKTLLKSWANTAVSGRGL